MVDRDTDAVNKLFTSDEIFKAIVARGVFPDRIKFKDTLYCLPTEKWVETSLGPRVYRRFFAGDVRWVEGKWECNKFSVAVAEHAYEDWRITPSPPAALAFGTFDYMDGVVTHEINIGMHLDDNGRLYPRFYKNQPEPGVFTCLTPIELDSDSIQSCLECAFL